MDKQTRISSLALRLHQAGGRRDWAALKRIDAELAAHARTWAYDKAWSPAEQQALSQLRQAHEAAADQCGNELQALEETLNQINSQQGRWSAYAQSSNWEDSRS